MIVDTTLMSELEQFLLNSVIARVLFTLRRALKASDSRKLSCVKYARD